MNKLFSVFSNLFTGGSKTPDDTNTTHVNLHNSTKINYSNMTTSKKIKKIFEVENLDSMRESTTQKIIYNERVYFNPLKDNSKEEMNKVINNVIKSQTQKVEIEKEGKNIYKVNLNINNNYYGSNFNINYNDKVDNNNSTKMLPNTENNSRNGYNSNSNTNNNSPNLDMGIGQLKSVPCKGGGVQDMSNQRNSQNSINNSRSTNGLKKKKSEKDNLTVPCLNCGNLIDIEEIENHSNDCLIVSKEVYTSMNESSELHTFNTKLLKLDECISKYKNKDNRDSHYYVSLSNYLISSASIII